MSGSTRQLIRLSSTFLLFLAFGVRSQAQTNATNTGTFYLSSGTVMSADGSFTNTGTATNAGSFYIKGILVTSAGPFSNTGTLITLNTSSTPITPGLTWGGTVEYAITGGAQTVVTGTYNNLKLSNTSGTNTASGNVTVGGVVTLSGGTLTTNANTVYVNSTGMVSRLGGHIVGNLKKYFATGVAGKTFEVGDAINYTPLTLAFPSVTTAGDITASVTPTDHLNLAGSGIRTDRSVNRFATLTNSGIAFTTADLTINWVAGDKDPLVTTGSFKVGKYNSSSWTLPTVASPLATSIQATGLTSFGDFAVGELCAPLSAAFSYAGSPYCSNGGIATPTITGSAGTFTSAAGLSINPSTGVIDLAASTAGTYTVTNIASGAGGCSTSSTATITITAAQTPTITYTGNPYCSSGGTAVVTLAGTTGGTFSTTGLTVNSTTGDITLATATAGDYTITYTIAASGGCGIYQATTGVTINSIGTWSGSIDKTWNVPGNWQCNTVPTSTTNVIIPSGRPNYPIISTITGTTNNLTLQAGASITITSGSLKIGGNVSNTGGTIVASTGKVEFNGTALQTVPAGLFSSNTIKDLVITNAADVNLAGPLRVTGTVGFGSVDGSVLSSNGNLTLVSTSANTANLLDVTNGGTNTGNTVAGDVIVERYIQGKRAYRFLTAPVNSTTSIKTNWMEGVSNASPWVNNNPISNYGTHITGVSPAINSFDATQTNNPSMFTFNLAGQSWTPIPNSSGLFSAGTGYRIIVRGSRSVDLNNNDAVSSTTTLRAKGTLLTGPVTFTKAGGGGTPGMPALAPGNGNYSFIANPYAAAVDWQEITKMNFTDLAPTMYLFDPTVTGKTGRGDYVAFNSLLKVISNISSSVTKDMQSGQAFFVMATGPNPSLTFQEPYKNTVNLPIFRSANDVPHININLLLPSQVNAGGSVDGTAVYFSNDYSNSIGNDDSYKFTNQDENIAILRDGKMLSIEGRKAINGSDSVPLKIWQLAQNSYTLKVSLDKFGSNVETYLEDEFLKTTTPLTNGDNLVPFSITSNAGSGASNRFNILFESLATLPVKLTGIKANEKNKGVQVEWTTESESNIDRYEVERSANAQQFETIATVKAKNTPAVSLAYNSFDANPLSGDNYYRVKSTDKEGNIIYSEVVKVQVKTTIVNITATANATVKNSFIISFNNVEKGNYSVSVINNAGQVVYEGMIEHAGGTAHSQVNLLHAIASGIYQVQISKGSKVQTLQVLF